MSHDDFAFEPIRGLPAMLPTGEHLLWQGSPRWKSLAVRAYHVRKVAIYFALIIAWRVAVGLTNGHTISAIVISCAFLLTLGMIGIGLLLLLAYLNSRSTVYSVTSHRVLLRHGVAVPMTMDIPFALVESADLKSHGDGTGDIVLTVPREQRVGYLITWPHLRPGQFARPRPSLRALPDAVHAAQLLGSALAAEIAAPTAQVPVQANAPVDENTAPSFGPRTAAA